MMIPVDPVDYLILGAGYVGTELHRQLQQRYPESTLAITRRQAYKGILRFDLDHPASWQLPNAHTVFWTFPAMPIELVRRFWKTFGGNFHRCIVIGSTGIFMASENAFIDERSPMDPHHRRYAGEAFLRSQGAILLLSAGIYGPGRNPVDWIKQRRLPSPDKIINLVHVFDLCQFLLRAVERGCPGDLFIASDGHPVRWSKIIGYARKQGLVSQPEFSGKSTISKTISKRLDNRWSRKTLDIEPKYNDVFKGLDDLCHVRRETDFFCKSKH